MSVLQSKKILIGISGGIAAYKIPILVRLLIKKGAEVKVVMTPMSTQFVTPLTLSTVSKNEVGVQLSDEQGNWTNHVELGLWADFMIIAPATANILAKMAHGEADNLLLTTYLSMPKQVYAAPAMDLDMYQHEQTQENIKSLEKQNVKIIPPNSGELASGLVGPGRMAEPEEIVAFVENDLKKELDFSNQKVLITAGPTYEPLDPVRFIGNHSSGKMGFALAEEAAKRGADVILITGPTHETISNDSIILVPVTTAQQMYDAVFQDYTDSDIAIMSAAVADFRPSQVSEEKIKKGDSEEMTVTLVKNPDILRTMGKEKENQYLVGFALETQNEEENAKKKLKAKNLDLIVLNSLKDKGAGFQSNTNKVTLIDKEEEVKQYEVKSKSEVAKDIFDFISKNRQS